MWGRYNLTRLLEDYRGGSPPTLGFLGALCRHVRSFPRIIFTSPGPSAGSSRRYWICKEFLHSTGWSCWNYRTEPQVGPSFSFFSDSTCWKKRPRSTRVGITWYFLPPKKSLFVFFGGEGNKCVTDPPKKNVLKPSFKYPLLWFCVKKKLNCFSLNKKNNNKKPDFVGFFRGEPAGSVSGRVDFGNLGRPKKNRQVGLCDSGSWNWSTVIEVGWFLSVP